MIMGRQSVFAVLGLLVGVAIGFGIAYLIWTLDGQPARGDMWALAGAVALTSCSWAGMYAGMRFGER
jgi:predicted aconitase